MYINIKTPIERKNLLSEMKSLQGDNNEKQIPIYREHVENECSEKKKKKDKKDKKNKKKGLMALDLTYTQDLFDDIETEQKSYTLDQLIDDELYDENPDGMPDEFDGIIDENRKGYTKLKTDENAYKKEFAAELTLLYNLLDETSKFGKELERKYNSLENSKVRGISKYTNELAETILSSKQNKLNILKEISGIKKTISDLKIKTEGKNKAGTDGGASSEAIAAQYLKGILQYGRQNFVKNLTTNPPIQEDEFDTDLLVDADDLDAKTNVYGIFPSAVPELRVTEDRYAQMIRDRLMTEQNPYRTEDGNKYIQYENRDVKIMVKRCIDTNEWEFVAIDKDSMQVSGYPLPNPASCKPMTFSGDGRLATDSKARTYKVISYHSPIA